MKSNWSYGIKTANLGFDLCNLDFWPLTLNFSIVITSVIGNHSWKFHDDTMMGTYWKRCDRHRQTDGQTDRKTESNFFKGTSIWKCYLQNVGHFFRPKHRLIWCLFFINVYHQPKLKREIVHISKFLSKILYESNKNCLIHSQLHWSACRILNESQGCAEHFFQFRIKPLHNVCANQVQ